MTHTLAHTSLEPFPPLQKHATLQALAVVLVRCLAGIGRSANSRAGPPLAAALSIVSRGAGRARATRARSGAAASASARARAGARARASGALADGLLGGAGAVPALCGDDLEVLGAELEAVLGPGVEVVLDGDGAAGAGGIADRDELLEGRRALDRRRVRARALPHRVRPAVAGDGALLRSGARGCGVVLDHVVFHQRIGRPAVDGEPPVACRGEGAAISDGAGGADATVRNMYWTVRAAPVMTHFAFPGFQPIPTTKS